MARKPLVSVRFSEVDELPGEDHWKSIARCIDAGVHFERQRNLGVFSGQFQTNLKDAAY